MRETEHWTEYPPDSPAQDGVWCSKCERWDEDCRCESDDRGPIESNETGHTSA